MKILITGGTGLLGKALIGSSSRCGEIMATYHAAKIVPGADGAVYRKLDVRDREGCLKLFDDFVPDIVIHTAGLGSPDYSEKHRKETEAINITGTANVINACERTGASFIYISSNGIYDGSGAPYGEDDVARPINYYGEIKLAGERLTRQARVPHAVVRPMLMYGWNHPSGRPNIATFAISRLADGQRVHAYDDVYVTPLYAEHCALAIWRIIKQRTFDTFNIGGKDRMSIYDLVRAVASVFGFDGDLVVPVKQGFFNELVKRPRDTSFDTSKMHAVLDVRPVSVLDGLRAMVRSGEVGHG